MVEDEEYFEMCSFWHEGDAPDVMVFRNGQISAEDSFSHSRTVPLICAAAEDAIEAQSAASGGGQEEFLHHWDDGIYSCARCHRQLYHSHSKWQGPCAWPSFRSSMDNALKMRPVTNYGRYRCAVMELYCGGCRLFIGHGFQDALEKGDEGPECTGWRH
ncbi:unnamed protein product [Effrenium voratum]|uniref:MsrB domain-containing protein n=1 Tax=Effrenium voratum TaxID=2562239 RepID=A0AA36MZ51_9DINO|nr:unnamed protein product [Effrenium voratum]CAJ1383928.1 unnamed protein product [Effrenium voratum]